MIGLRLGTFLSPEFLNVAFEMFLTHERRSYDDGVLVVGQLGDAVGVLGGAEMEHVPHIFAFVAHGFGASRVTNGSRFYVLARRGGDACSRDRTHLLPVAMNSFL